MYGNPGELSVTTLLRRRWRLVAAFTLVAGGLAGTGAFLLPPRYTAKAQLLQETEYHNGVPVRDDTAVDTLVELLLSANQLRKLDAHLSQMKPQPALHLPDYAALQDHLSVYRESHSRLIAVTYSSPDPKLATLVANEAVKVYENDVSRSLQADQEAALASVAKRLTTAQEHLDRADANLRDFRLSYGEMKQGQTGEIEAQIGLLNQQLSIANAELSAKDSLLKGTASASAGPVRVATASTAVGALGSGDGRSAAAQAVPPVASRQLTLERDATAARLQDIEARLKTLRDAAAASGEQQARLRALEQDATAAKKVFQSLTQRQADLVARGAANLPARIVTLAAQPSRPSSPSPFLFLLPSLLGSAVLAGMIALLLERGDRRLRSEWDVETALGVPCAGLVPVRRRGLLRRSRELLPANPLDPYVEGLRAVTLAANRHVRSGELPRSFLFTAGANGEGTTTLAVSFALYAARLKQRVLLMDLNLRRPGVAGALGDHAPAVPGEALPGLPLATAIQTIDGLGIDYLAPKQDHDDPLGALLTEEFSTLMARVGREYDCVVIDSAPVASAAETRLLSVLVDRIMFVVRWGATDATAARAAIRSLRSQEGHAPIAAVVTQVNLRRHARLRYGQTSPTDGPVQPAPAWGAARDASGWIPMHAVTGGRGSYAVEKGRPEQGYDDGRFNGNRSSTSC